MPTALETDPDSAAAATINIASHLPAIAASQPQTVALRVPIRGRAARTRYLEWTYADLEHAANDMARRLAEKGVTRGTRTALLVPPSAEFFAVVFALFKLGAVMVCVDPGIGVRNMGKCLDEAEPEAFIGVPKGVVYTHGNFDAQVRALTEHFGIRPGEVDLCTFPLFALYAPAMGMSAIVPRMDFTRPGRVDPREVIEPIRRFSVTNMFGSPALLRRVLEDGDLFGDKPILPSLRRVISAGAPVPAAVIRGWTEQLLADDAQVHTPYGATESLPVACSGSDEILGETAAHTDTGRGVCVGRPVGDVTVRVIRISDEPIAQWSDDLCVDDGTVGEICVKGPVVTASYHNREQHTQLAKIRDPSGGFWHRMGDVGYLDEQGRVWFCGRKSHRVRTRDGDLHTAMCEPIFNTHPAVARTALVGVPTADGETQLPVLCVEMKKKTLADSDVIKEDFLRFGAQHDHTRAIEDVLFYPRPFPVDIRHNAKIGREQLAEWATRELERGRG